MIFRISQKLGKKIKEKPTTALPLNENPYADWSADLFTFDRAQYIIVSNTTSLYSAVMYGAGITDDNKFINRSFDCIREFMIDDGLEFVYRRFIAPASGEVSFSKSLNRKVTGSLAELVKIAKFVMAREEISPHELGSELNEMLLSALSEFGSRNYGTPNEAMRKMGDQFTLE